MHQPMRCLSAALALLFWPLAAAQAQGTYPSQPVKIIVANTPGTAVDTLVRVLTPKLSEVLGQQFVVDNRAGAGGAIGAEAAARSAPDGYTLLATSTPLQVIAPHLRQNLRYDPFADFEPVAMIARTENVMIVHPPVPLKSVQDVIAYAKANPGKLKMANAGIGFQSHLANVMFTGMSGIDVLHVPYKGASSSNSVMTGESDLTISPLPSVMSMIRAGGVRALAVTGLKRTPVAPELPTIDESGVPGYSGSGWVGFVVPKGTPAEVRTRLVGGLSKVLADQPTRDLVLRAGGEPWFAGPEEMMRTMKEDFARYGKVIKDNNVRVE